LTRPFLNLYTAHSDVGGTTGVIHCVFDQIPNLPNCFTNPNKNLGGEVARGR
jgi:hypothetical protein